MAGRRGVSGGGGDGGGDKSKMRSSSRSAFSFPDIRRLLLQGARAARGSPPLGRSGGNGGGMCDPEKGNAGGSAASPTVGSKSHGESNKHASSHNLHGTPHNHHHHLNHPHVKVSSSTETR